MSSAPGSDEWYIHQYDKMYGHCQTPSNILLINVYLYVACTFKDILKKVVTLGILIFHGSDKNNLLQYCKPAGLEA